MTDGQYIYFPSDAVTFADVFLFGANTSYRIVSSAGLISQPPMVVSTAKTTGRHGGLKAGPRTYDARKILFEINVLAEPPLAASAVEGLLDALHKAFRITEGEGLLIIDRVAKEQRVIWCHPTRAEFVADYDAWTGLIKGAVELEALDPIFYSAAMSLVLKPGLTSGTVNRTYPRTYPVVYGTSSSSSPQTGSFYNSGTIASYPVIQVIGPILNPTLRNQTTNESLTLNRNIHAGEVVEIDMRIHSVRIGDDSIRGSIGSSPRWWGLMPGENLISFTGAGATSQTQATITGASAWPSA